MGSTKMLFFDLAFKRIFYEMSSSSVPEGCDRQRVPVDAGGDEPGLLLFVAARLHQQDPAEPVAQRHLHPLPESGHRRHPLLLVQLVLETIPEGRGFTSKFFQFLFNF